MYRFFTWSKSQLNMIFMATSFSTSSIFIKFSPVNTTLLTFSGLQQSHPSYQVPKTSCSDLTNATTLSSTLFKN
ncbi:hypothetical protein BpHYR1_021442 [Brachionus plicatilis]|uniref:Uncharacterized protein n=1 Tax=Brachionus plicatilis TaxID=10195 RepID=A0A3M7P7J3_BRAPC|nr:hypothetical protein BpHYR1_021442 [Brachionus plicatilis]